MVEIVVHVTFCDIFQESAYFTKISLGGGAAATLRYGFRSGSDLRIQLRFRNTGENNFLSLWNIQGLAHYTVRTPNTMLIDEACEIVMFNFLWWKIMTEYKKSRWIMAA
jgi:hypothetical protein